MSRVKKVKEVKQTLEQYLAGWKEATADLFVDEKIMELFLELKKRQYLED
jgi:hypothetical protein